MTNPITAKLIKSLYQKKYRQEKKKFLVEGEKSVLELLKSDFNIEYLYATKEFVLANGSLIENKKARLQVVDASELKAIGTLMENEGALAVVHQKPLIEPKDIQGVTIVLDDIRDPGNMGTIIRIADWYGVNSIICGETCVDWYNPKVISASKGSFTRVQGYYTNLFNYLKNKKIPIIGASLNGTSVREFAFPGEGFLIIGSESHGISREVLRLLSDKVTIPKLGKAESLNAAVAGGIILDRWAGSMLKKK